MTPEERAIELFELFYDDRLRASLRGKIKNAKYLALKCVDKILEQLNTMRDKFNETEMNSCGNHTLVKINYWNEVKKEIEKL